MISGTCLAYEIEKVYRTSASGQKQIRRYECNRLDENNYVENNRRAQFVYVILRANVQSIIKKSLLLYGAGPHG